MNKTAYNIVNTIVILVSVGLFVSGAQSAYGLFADYPLGSLLVLVCSVLLVHVLKASRLYLALYGADMNGKSFLKTYCKVTPVSVIFPFKTGEIFRMYCYGQLIGNMLRSIVIILLDRFMDTCALVTVIFLTWFLNGGKLDLLVYLLLFFLILVLVLYVAYPGIRKFWTQYLLKSKATARKLALLKSLDKMNDIYGEIENVARGRGILLYLFSLAAWGVEIGNLYLGGRISSASEINRNVFDYLRAALSNSQSVELRRFIVVTILLLLAVYAVLKLADVIWEKRDKK